MRHLSRVVWNEGMYLAQHHFQTQSRYFEDTLQFAVSALFFGSYGLAGCQLDSDALLNGTVALLHARGMMPDGLTFNVPECDAAPPPLEIAATFSPTQDSHLILLTIPSFRAGAANTALETNGGPELRYRAETSMVPDDTTGRDERPVALGRKNLRLRLDTALAEHETSLPIARVRRDGQGHFIYDPDYIPPCVQIGASERLMSLLGRLVDMLEAKSASLPADRPAAHRELREYASQEVANFWLLHAVRSSLPPLRHHLELRRSHPEQLYAEMARLAGALCTFALDAHPRTVPAYDHDRPDQCFAELDRQIRAHLEIIVPTNCLTIPLARTSQFLYVGAVKDRRCFGPSEWILGVRSDAGRADIITKVPKLVKMCSSRHVERLFKEALPGLTLQHLPSPPAAVSPRVGTEYFLVGRRGDHSTVACWTAIGQTSEVGVYVPGALPGVELELMVVLEA
ncbi:MAG: type VI secretion system baseplate subunit TssK [Gemmatimonadales bacterium]|jgi:type VI secretion system protein ImpJ